MTDYDNFDLAEKYQITDVSYRKIFFISPTYIKLLGNVKGKTVIDFGCGSGFSSRLIMGEGAKKVIGVDRSKKQILLARKKETIKGKKVKYFVKDIADPNFFCNFKCDIAGAELVLHNAKTKKELFLMCSNISKTLKKGGRFVTVNQDPLYLKKGGIKYNETYKYSKNAEGGKIFCTLYSNSKKKICSLHVYHWSKKTYEDALRKAGFGSIKWHPLIGSPDSINVLGARQADSFLRALPSVGISCIKL